MNRNYISLLLVFILTIGVGSYVYYTKAKSFDKKIEGLNFVTVKASTIIQISNPNQNLEELFSSNLIWKQIKSNSGVKVIEEFWSINDSNFNKFKEEAKSLVYFKNEKEYYFILEMNEIQEDSVNITKWKSKSKDRFIIFTKTGDFNSLAIINDTIESVSDDNSFQTLVKTKGNEEVTIFQHENKTWQSYGLMLSSDQFFASGMEIKTAAVDIKNSQFDFSIFEILPSEFESIDIRNFNSEEIITTDSAKLKQKAIECSCNPYFSATSWIENTAVWYKSMYDNGQYIIFKSAEINDFKNGVNDLLPDSLKWQEEENFVVRDFNNAFDYNSIFNSKISLNHFVRINDFIVFSDSKNELERLIFQYNSNLTISYNEKLLDFISGNITTKSNQVVLSGGFLLGDIEIDEGISIYQSHQENKDLKYNSHLFSTEIKLDGSRTNPKWKLDFETGLNAKIYVVKNHTTFDNDYLIQDQSNTLYFITPNGKIKWKREIENPIVGEVKNIDILGNNKYQMAFNTKNKLFVIDILGRDVENFPVPILDSATANVSAVDYDNKNIYRFLVPTTKGIKNIDEQGNIVKGWMQPNPSSVIPYDIDYLTIKGKDYLIAQGVDNSLYFYNRKGELRHSVNQPLGYPREVIKGSSISKTRAIFLDKKSNTINRQFFNNSPPSILLASTNTINKFVMMDYDGDANKEFVLITNTEILIYSENLTINEKIQLPEGASNVQIFEGGFGYINQFGDLAIVRGKVTKVIGGANSYKIDFFKNQLRVLIVGDKDFKLLLL